MAHLKVLLLASLSGALANTDGEESSLLQVQRPPSRDHSLLDENVDCASGKCKPVPKKTTTQPPTTTTTTTTTTSTTTTTTTTTSTTSTTTTTTTSGPPVNPDADCNGVSCDTVCSGTVLHFDGGNIVENTLAGTGHSGGGRMKIVDVAEGIDLYVSDTKGEKLFDASSANYKSGYPAGSWMTGKTGIYKKSNVEKDALRIAMEATGTYEFKFELKNKAGEAVALDEFPLVFYDMDYYEGVESCGHTGYVINGDTDLRKMTASPGCDKYQAGYKSADSPDDFDHLTSDQAKATVAFVYENTSEWTMKFQLKYYGHRWVLFKSSKALACE